MLLACKMVLLPFPLQIRVPVLSLHTDVSRHVEPTMIIHLALCHLVWFSCWLTLSVGLETLSKTEYTLLFTLFCYFINLFGQSFAHQTKSKATEVFVLIVLSVNVDFFHTQAALAQEKVSLSQSVINHCVAAAVLFLLLFPAPLVRESDNTIAKYDTSIMSPK